MAAHYLLRVGRFFSWYSHRNRDAFSVVRSLATVIISHYGDDVRNNCRWPPEASLVSMLIHQHSAFSLTVAGLVRVVPAILRTTRKILRSKDEAREMAEQRKKFERFMWKVETSISGLLRGKSRLVPKNLLRSTRRLVSYCREEVRAAEKYCIRFQESPFTSRLLHYMLLPLGYNKIASFEQRIRECEDSLRIALSAITLYVLPTTYTRITASLPHMLIKTLLKGTRTAYMLSGTLHLVVYSGNGHSIFAVTSIERKACAI